MISVFATASRGGLQRALAGTPEARRRQGSAGPAEKSAGAQDERSKRRGPELFGAGGCAARGLGAGQGSAGDFLSKVT